MPDVGMTTFQVSRQQKIIAACEKCWPAYSSDCSGFVKAVAQELGVSLYGNANAIFDEIHNAPWQAIGSGDSSATCAGVAASNGLFVVGAWKNPNSGESGHVAVIVDSNNSSHTVPYRNRAMAYWGQLGGVGEKYEMHSQSWGSSKRPEVFYSSHVIS